MRPYCTYFQAMSYLGMGRWGGGGMRLGEGRVCRCKGVRAGMLRRYAVRRGAGMLLGSLKPRNPRQHRCRLGPPGGQGQFHARLHRCLSSPPVPPLPHSTNNTSAHLSFTPSLVMMSVMMTLFSATRRNSSCALIFFRFSVSFISLLIWVNCPSMRSTWEL